MSRRLAWLIALCVVAASAPAALSAQETDAVDVADTVPQAMEEPARQAGDRSALTDPEEAALDALAADSI